jgi:hypothetical protein
MKAFAALIVMTMAIPAIAADSKPADSQAQAGAEAPKKERQICKREATSTGLHSTRKVCMTAAEWRARNRNSEDGDMGAVTARN